MLNTVKGAEILATKLLADDPRRLKHVQGVVQHMAEWLNYVGETGETYDMYMQIAWLHDIGYSKALIKEDFHAVDGYTYLMSLGWSYPVCVGILVHSFSYELAALSHPHLQELYGLKEQVDCINANPNIFNYISMVDLHTSPVGEFISFEERRQDIYKRYGEHPVTWHIYTIADKLNYLKYQSDFTAFEKEKLKELHDVI